MTDDICLRTIDAEHLENVENNREAVQFRARLSAIPSEIWAAEFNALYKTTPYTLKPPVTVEGDTLHIVFLPRYVSELQGFFQFLGLILRQANEEARRSDALHTSSEQEKRKAEFRDALRQVKVP